ncbi:MAG: hypothetical protein GY789_16160 [Hyphomicrobiales bacterium]|nr:hypothetical protein [Hyphomicrobiales bacterium]MCP5002108.1 hypothetical protein [Hyphomicrobiales bacterium]
MGFLRSDGQIDSEVPMRTLKIGPRTFRLPQSRLIRMGLGGLLVIGGILGFLPVLGFWMIPLGLLILSHDLPIVRRWRRKLVVRFGHKKRKR